MTERLPPSIAAHVRQWMAEEITWGIFSLSEAAAGRPLGDVEGLDVVELGCGTAYVSAWLGRRGARPIGVDPTPAQLAAARRLQARTGLDFPLIEAPGERVPLPDGSADLVVSEYGASLWADPDHWISESARLLRPGGHLVFLTNSMVVYLCLPDKGVASETLQHPLFGMHDITWPGEPGVEYHLSHGDWIKLLRRSGFAIDDLVQIGAPADAPNVVHEDYVTSQWARRRPAEEI